MTQKRAATWFAQLLLLLMLTGACAQTAPQDPAAPPKQETPANLVVKDLDAGTANYGNTFLPLASEFGLTQFSFAGRAANGGVLYEYLPPGAKLEEWKILGSLYIVKVGQSFEDATPAVAKFATTMKNLAGNVHESETYPGPYGGLHFLHYTVGSGPIREEGLSAIWAVLPGMLANWQVMNRGEPYSAEQIAHFKSVAAGLAQSKPKQ